MTTFAMATLLQLSVLASIGADAKSYDDAYRATSKSGQPLVVMIGTDWCPACVQMKESVIPQIQRKGILKEVEFASVDSDAQGKLASKLMRGSSIPQLIVFRKTADGWKRKQLTGAHSATAVESFLREETKESDSNPSQFSNYQVLQ